LRTIKKAPMNEYKNLDKVVKYDGDFALLDINFNLKDDVVLANNKELINRLCSNLVGCNHCIIAVTKIGYLFCIIKSDKIVSK
jgi:hypothetical protein